MPYTRRSSQAGSGTPKSHPTKYLKMADDGKGISKGKTAAVAEYEADITSWRKKHDVLRQRTSWHLESLEPVQKYVNEEEEEDSLSDSDSENSMEQDDCEQEEKGDQEEPEAHPKQPKIIARVVTCVPEAPWSPRSTMAPLTAKQLSVMATNAVQQPQAVQVSYNNLSKLKSGK